MPIGCAFIARDVIGYDEYQLETLSRQYPDPDLIVDVGAFTGLFAAYAHELWPDAPILCVEPDPDAAKLCRQIHGVTWLVEAAAWNSDGELNLMRFRSEAMPCNFMQPVLQELRPGRPEEYYPRRVKAVRLATALTSLGLAPCHALLKLDCEGSEAAVLQDIKATGLLGAFDCICGETHSNELQQATWQALRADFRVMFHDRGGHIGNFWAYRA